MHHGITANAICHTTLNYIQNDLLSYIDDFPIFPRQQDDYEQLYVHYYLGAYLGTQQKH